MGEGADIIVTNGPYRGWAFLRGNCYPFEPPTVPMVREIGAGDAFVAEFTIQNVLKSQPLRVALDEWIEFPA